MRPRGRGLASIPRGPTCRRRRWKREEIPEIRSLGESGGGIVREKSVKSIVQQGLTPGGLATETRRQSVNGGVKPGAIEYTARAARDEAIADGQKCRPQHFRPFFLSFSHFICPFFLLLLSLIVDFTFCRGANLLESI